jgi:hypothetical protein
MRRSRVHPALALPYIGVVLVMLTYDHSRETGRRLASG